MLDLKELAFTAGEFKEVGLIRLWMESETFADAGVPDRIAKIANAILAEKLARAPVVFNDGHLYLYSNWRHQDKPTEGDTHTARLVCIEKLEKPE